jgi:UDP-N-acetyl-D-galactosamine dehydrogenase
MIGLGYVGLPLAIAFAKKYPVVGFDISQKRVNELNNGNDLTLEVTDENLNQVLKKNLDLSQPGFFISCDTEDIAGCNIYIITVPTPVDFRNIPDLSYLVAASETVGKVLSKGDLVIYESTVYPGATEEECIPVVEKSSGLRYNIDFFAGYSPERVNPGDKLHTVERVKKVTSGSTSEIAERVDDLYASVITAGTHRAPSIKVAEAAKVIENTQRDINIAFVNELAKIFNKLDIDTNAVLEAAGTKWNFLPFKPGLVGGHCIGVDPYYLAQKAEEMGYHPELILAGRRTNDGMGAYIAGEVVKQMIKKGTNIKAAKALILGITFKENCTDIRNTKVIDVIRELMAYSIAISVYDPWANNEEIKSEFGLELVTKMEPSAYDVVVLTVGHNEFKHINPRELLTAKGLVYDVKGFFTEEMVDCRL